MEQKPVTTGAGLWPDPDNGPFRVYLWWAVIDDRQELAGLTLSSLPSDQGWENPPEWTTVQKVKDGDDGIPIPYERKSTWRGPVRLSADTLRSLTDGRQRSLTQIVEDTKESLVGYVGMWARHEPERIAELEEKVRAIEAGQRKGTAGRPAKWGPQHYADVALVYEDAHKGSRKPTRAVAQHWGVSSSTAANWVAKARELGLLGKTSRGKAGGIRPSEGDEEK